MANRPSRFARAGGPRWQLKGRGTPRGNQREEENASMTWKRAHRWRTKRPGDITSRLDRELQGERTEP